MRGRRRLMLVGKSFCGTRLPIGTARVRSRLTRGRYDAAGAQGLGPHPEPRSASHALGPPRARAWSYGDWFDSAWRARAARTRLLPA